MKIKNNVSWNEILPKSCREEMIRNKIELSDCSISREQVLADLKPDKYDLIFEGDIKTNKSKLTWVGSTLGAESVIPNGNSDLIGELMGW
tara:strand:+ start:191 stop:460 length:270 start_codon:yes stop_codon:yes gene_type:complete